MSSLKWSICGGVVSVLAWSSSTSLALGQGGCACHRSGMGDGVVYESSTTPISEADALLAEVDNPAELINLTVIVHEKAIVSINGEPTFTMGTTRPYIVRGLKSGLSYKFEIKGLLKNESGAEYAAKETVTLKAGDPTKQVVLHLRRQNRTPLDDPKNPRAAMPPATATAK